MKNQVKRFTQFINENYHHESDMNYGHEAHHDHAEMSDCCGSVIDESGYCTECGEAAGHSMHDEYNDAPYNHSAYTEEELYEAKKKAQIDALKEVDKKFANLKPAAKKKGKAAEEEEEMEEAPKKGANAKPAAKGMPFGKPAAKGNPFAKKDEKPAAKGMPFGKPAAKPAAKPFGFQKKGANKENEM
jgi:hypothetical protein